MLSPVVSQALLICGALCLSGGGGRLLALGRHDRTGRLLVGAWIGSLVLCIVGAAADILPPPSTGLSADDARSYGLWVSVACSGVIGATAAFYGRFGQR